MKISVCFKVLPDFDKVPKKDWEHPEKLDFEYVKNILGVFDEGALESALCIKDEMKASGAECFLEAITYGNPDEIFVSTLYAVGFDRVVEIHGENMDFSPEDTAEALGWYLDLSSSQTLKHGYGTEKQAKCNNEFSNKNQVSHNCAAEESVNGKAADNTESFGAADNCSKISDSELGIILLGKMTGPNDSGTVPYFLAEKLGLPVINKVTGFEYKNGITYICRRGSRPVPESVTGVDAVYDTCDYESNTAKKMEKSDASAHIPGYEKSFLEKYVYKTPVVAVVEDAEKPYLRMYTLMSMMENKDKKSEVVEYRGKSGRKKDYKIVPLEKRQGRYEFLEMESQDVAGYLMREIQAALSKVESDINKKKGQTVYKESITKEFKLREVYSGYLGLKPKQSLFSGKSKAENLITAEEFYKKVLETQTEYRIPDIVEDLEIAEDNLSEAEVVVAIGRGAESRENYLRLKAMAEKLKISVGCTRLAAMSGYDDYSKVIGISGKTLKARLCICIGVSGAGPFVKGLESVEKVIAINNDKDAIIFDRADVGIVCDIRDLIK